jgi:hypothetical protein
LLTSSKPLPKRVFHRIPSSASYFKFQYFFALKFSSSCLRLFSRLAVPSIFPSIRQFLRSIGHILLTLLHCIIPRMLLFSMYLIYLLLIYRIFSINQTSVFWEVGQCRIYFTEYGRSGHVVSSRVPRFTQEKIIFSKS